jgi:hypothetical protein
MERKTIWRQELKFRVSRADRELLLRRLSAALRPDSHGKNGVYNVRTLYFDTLYDDALRESLAGEAEKVKFRLRMYNTDDSFLRLEKKIKEGGGGIKIGARLTRAECERLIRGDCAFLAGKDEPFLLECYAKRQDGGLRAKEIVDYTRAAFVCAQGNVRITVDSNIRACRFTDAFFAPKLGGAPVTAEDACVLEVKFDRFLPDYIPHLVGIGDREMQAFSKFALGSTHALDSDD